MMLTDDGGAVKWDQKLRARMVDTFDARAAGCSASAFEAAVYDCDSHEKGAAKKGAGGVRMRNFARTPAMTFVDEGLEAEYTFWQARQRWQVCSATHSLAPVAIHFWAPCVLCVIVPSRKHHVYDVNVLEVVQEKAPCMIRNRA